MIGPLCFCILKPQGIVANRYKLLQIQLVAASPALCPLRHVASQQEVKSLYHEGSRGLFGRMRSECFPAFSAHNRFSKWRRLSVSHWHLTWQLQLKFCYEYSLLERRVFQEGRARNATTIPVTERTCHSVVISWEKVPS